MGNSVTHESDTTAGLAFAIHTVFPTCTIFWGKLRQQNHINISRIPKISRECWVCWDTMNKVFVTRPSAAINFHHLPACPSLFVFISHCPSLFVLHLPSLCPTLSCLRASICLQSFTPSPQPPPPCLLLPPRFPLFPSVSFPVTPSSLPVWLKPWLVQLSITKAKPCQGRLDPEALLYPHSLSLLSVSVSFL